MAETIINNLERAEWILRNKPEGRWSISPRILDSNKMADYAVNLELSATREDLERYVALQQALAQLGLGIPEVRL